jgi:membrane protease YdiL (CAAX protease family)
MDAYKRNAGPGWALAFYAVAFIISAPFNSGYLAASYTQFAGRSLMANWSFIPAGIGTLTAALVAFRLDKGLKRTTTFFGNDVSRAITIAFVPVIVLTAMGIANNASVGPHYYALIFSVSALIYAIAEEIFWRSYLLDRLRPLGRPAYSLLIGVLWWAWHFRFSTQFDMTWFLLICVISSFLLCKFAEDTRSYLASASLHSLIIVTTSTGFNRAGMTSIVICIVVWMAMGKLLGQRTEAGKK